MKQNDRRNRYRSILLLTEKPRVHDWSSETIVALLQRAGIIIGRVESVCVHDVDGILIPLSSSSCFLCVCVYQSVYWSIHCNSGTEEEEEGKSTINLVHYDCGWCSITTRQCSGSYFTQLLAVSLFIFFLWVSRSIQEYYFFKVMKMATCWYRHASTPCNNRTSKISLLQSIIMVFLFCMNLFTVYT